MKKEIEKFKSQNGNINYTVKELLSALHTKLDRVEERLISGDKTFSKIETTIGIHRKLLYGIITALGSLLVLTLKLTGKI